MYNYYLDDASKIYSLRIVKKALITILIKIFFYNAKYKISKKACACCPTQ